jgi:hypothetical protein
MLDLGGALYHVLPSVEPGGAQPLQNHLQPNFSCVDDHYLSIESARVAIHGKIVCPLSWAQVRSYVVESLDSTTYKRKPVELCGNDRCNFIYIDRAER